MAVVEDNRCGDTPRPIGGAQPSSKEKTTHATTMSGRTTCCRLRDIIPGFFCHVKAPRVNSHRMRPETLFPTHPQYKGEKTLRQDESLINQVIPL